METYEAEELLDRTIKFWKEDVKLYSTGHSNIDYRYKVLMGSVTDITGYPSHGKTIFLVDVLYSLSQQYSMKHLLHLPDSGKPAEVMAMLISKKTGKSFEKNHFNRITDQEIAHSINWINEHFKILKHKKTERPTPIQFWEFTNELDVDTGSVDSWNYMKHEGSGTDYLAQTLSMRNELAEESGKHYFTIIHPKNPTSNDYDKNGNLKAPDVYNLMGGSEWNNNAKNVIAVHKERSDSDEFDVYFRKVKPHFVGKKGVEQMKFNKKTFRMEQLKAYQVVSDDQDQIYNQQEPKDLPF